MNNWTEATKTNHQFNSEKQFCHAALESTETSSTARQPSSVYQLLIPLPTRSQQKRAATVSYSNWLVLQTIHEHMHILVLKMHQLPPHSYSVMEQCATTNVSHYIKWQML